MGVIFRLLFLSALSACSFADDSLLAPGQKLNDFSWPSAFNNLPGQRLAEQIGHPVMLIWTDDCDRCEEQRPQGVDRLSHGRGAGPSGRRRTG